MLYLHRPEMPLSAKPFPFIIGDGMLLFCE